jgi:endo-1,4-beta-xylanase
MLNRRQILFGLGALAGLGASTASNRISTVVTTQAPNLGKRDFSVIGDLPLKTRAANKGLFFGTAVANRALFSDKQLASALIHECGIIVPESVLKWDSLCPIPEYYDFSGGDSVVDFAIDHNLLVRGHTLVWHKALPSWFHSSVNRMNANHVLTQHIQKVVKRYASKIHSWDVVNESILPEDGRSDGLRETPWLNLLGPDYIDLAFRTAAEIDPKAQLTLNEAFVGYGAKYDQDKQIAILKLLERLRSKGTPVHVLGIQAHWGLDPDTTFNPVILQRFLREVADLGLKIMITEMDVADRKLPKDITIRDRIVAATYEDYLNVVLEEPAVIAILTWGLSDRYTWLSTYDSRKDGAPVRPLPLDQNLKRKLAWNAIARSFDKAPKRSS